VRLSDLHHFCDAFLCDRRHRCVRGRQSERDQDKRPLILNDRNLYTVIAAVARVYATDPNYSRFAAVIASQKNVSQAIAAAHREAAA